MEKQITIGVGTIEKRGKVVPVAVVVKLLETEECPQCGNQVIWGKKFCGCGFNMRAAD